MIGNCLNVHQEKFKIVIRKNFIEWVVRLWNRQLRSLEELRGFVDVAFGDMVNMVISKVFSNLNYSVILW